MRICAGVLLTRGDHVLLGYRSASRAYYPSTWGVLGGHVKSGETIAEALAREVREEAGVTATEYHLLDILPSQIRICMAKVSFICMPSLDGMDRNPDR